MVLPSDKTIGKTKPFVDYQNDATAKDIKLALREGLDQLNMLKDIQQLEWELIKVNLEYACLGIIADTTGVKMGELGTTTFRPPLHSLTFGTIVGRNVGEYFDILEEHQ